MLMQLKFQDLSWKKMQTKTHKKHKTKVNTDLQQELYVPDSLGLRLFKFPQIKPQVLDLCGPSNID